MRPPRQSGPDSGRDSGRDSVRKPGPAGKYTGPKRGAQGAGKGGALRSRGTMPARGPSERREVPPGPEAAPRPEPRPDARVEPRPSRLTVPARPADGPARDTAGRGEATRSGSLWLYGIHAVAAALQNPARRLRRLVLTEEAEANLQSRLPQPWALAPERMERARIDQLLGRDAVHQGLALLADPLNPPPLSTVLERSGPILVLDQVSDPRNVGAILRSAVAFGAAAVIVQDRNAPDETGALAKAASGALEAVPLLRAVNLARTLVALKAAGLWTVGLAANAPRLDGTTLAGRRIALVMGGEGDGLRRLTRETCDEMAGLVMPGGMESLNVSAATAVALYELTRPIPPKS